jgi:hypothetical protein
MRILNTYFQSKGFSNMAVEHIKYIFPTNVYILSLDKKIHLYNSIRLKTLNAYAFLKRIIILTYLFHKNKIR